MYLQLATWLPLAALKRAGRYRPKKPQCMMGQHVERFSKGRVPCANSSRFGMLEPLVGAIAGIFLRHLASRASGLQSHRGAINAHLRSIVDTFVEGCNLALGQHDYDDLVQKLNSSKVGSYELRGFAFEGAAMTLSLLDLLVPWNGDRLQNFIE